MAGLCMCENWGGLPSHARNWLMFLAHHMGFVSRRRHEKLSSHFAWTGGRNDVKEGNPTS